MNITCISDLHGHYPELEGGDMLIVAGDLTAINTEEDFRYFCSWLNNQKYEEKIIVAGNHDTFMVDRPDWWYASIEYSADCTYLCDSGTEFEHEWTDENGVLCVKNYKIWGSPWTLGFAGMNPHCMAFTCKTQEELAEKWALIPDDVDILITHSPPKGILDKTTDGRTVGSQSLNNKIHTLQPRAHIFGHVHESPGKENYFISSTKYIGGVMCVFVNASLVNDHYVSVNKPIIIEI